jgi:hypothetical protein
MHPIQDLFLESFSYVLQFDMHFICTPMWKFFLLFVKSGCYRPLAFEVGDHVYLRVSPMKDVKRFGVKGKC